MNEFFQWERQAAVLPLMVCMDAWMEPTKDRFGMAWPDTYLKYSGDVVSWYTKMDGLHEFGHLVIGQHMKEGGLEEFDREVSALAKKLDGTFKTLVKCDWKSFDDPELLAKYEMARGGMVESHRITNTLLSCPDILIYYL